MGQDTPAILVHKRIKQGVERVQKLKRPRNAVVKRWREKKEAGGVPAHQGGNTNPEKATALLKPYFFGNPDHPLRCPHTKRDGNRCKNVRVRNFNKCVWHLSRHDKNRYKSQRNRDVSAYVRRTIRQDLYFTRIVLKREAWCQPMWQNCAQHVSVVPPAGAERASLLGLSFDELLFLRRRRRARGDDRSRATVWFETHLAEMLLAWDAYLAGDMDPWFDLLQRGQSVRADKPAGPAPASLRMAI